MIDPDIEDLHLITPKDLIAHYANLYNEEFGSIKGTQIVQKINSSSTVARFIRKINNERSCPGEYGFITVVNSIPYFFFGNGEALGLGALMGIYFWIEQSGSKLHVTEKKLKKIVWETVINAEKTKVNKTRENNFFKKYYDRIDKAVYSAYLQSAGI